MPTLAVATLNNEALFTSMELCEHTGLTYRMLTHWKNSRVILPAATHRGVKTTVGRTAQPGTGVHLLWSAGEVAIAHRLVDLQNIVGAGSTRTLQDMAERLRKAAPGELVYFVSPDGKTVLTIAAPTVEETA